MLNSDVLNASPFRHALRPLPDKAVSHALRSSGQNTGDIGAKAIAEVLKVNTVLTKLELGSNSIGDGGAKAIAEARS